jgi:KUP system potassium uptake protein
VFLTTSLDTVPTALLRNAEHNGIVHERVILVKIATVGVPHVPEPQRVAVKHLRLGFVAIAATYGYQDEPNVVAALEQARRQGLDIDLERMSYYVDHVTIVPTGRARMPGWRKRLFALLHQNSNPVARSYNIPSGRVFEVGAYVEL